MHPQNLCNKNSPPADFSKNRFTILSNFNSLNGLLEEMPPTTQLDLSSNVMQGNGS